MFAELKKFMQFHNFVAQMFSILLVWKMLSAYSQK